MPPRNVQDRIVDVLTAFDDLMRNSLRRLTVLDEIARRLYKEWFIDYRFPGHEDAKFTSNTTGRTPANWRRAALGESLDFVMGQSPRSEYYNDTDDGLPFHQGVGTYGRRYPEHERWTSKWSRQANDGDLLVSVRAPVGRLNVADKVLALGRGLAAVRPKDGFSSYWFDVLRHIFRDEDAYGGGTIFKAVTGPELFRIEHLTPPEAIRREFNDLTQPMFELDQQLDRRNRVLRTARELLLPAFLSGSIEARSLGLDTLRDELASSDVN